MNRKSGIILLAAFVLLGLGLAACGSNNCGPACTTGQSCFPVWFASVYGNSVSTCVNYCEANNENGCSEPCNGIVGCVEWASCVSAYCAWWVWD